MANNSKNKRIESVKKNKYGTQVTYTDKSGYWDERASAYDAIEEAKRRMNTSSPSPRGSLSNSVKRAAQKGRRKKS